MQSPLDKFDAVAAAACATPKSSAAKKGKGFGAGKLLALPAPPKDLFAEESESQRIRAALGHLVMGGAGESAMDNSDDDDDLVFVSSESWATLMKSFQVYNSLKC